MFPGLNKTLGASEAKINLTMRFLYYSDDIFLHIA